MKTRRHSKKRKVPVSISLPEDMIPAIKRQVKKRGFKSRSDYIRYVFVKDLKRIGSNR